MYYRIFLGKPLWGDNYDTEHVRSCLYSGEKLDDDTMFAIIGDDVNDFLPAFIQYKYLDEWISKKLSHIHYTNIYRNHRRLLKFCSKYYNKHITDEIILKTTFYDILHNRMRIFPPKSLIVDPNKVICAFHNIVRSFGDRIENMACDMIEIFLYLKKNIVVDYNMIRQLSGWYFCENILTVFEHIISPNAVDYISNIILSPNITTNAIDTLYNWGSATLTCDIETFVALTKRNYDTTGAILMHIYKKDQQLRHNLDNNLAKLFNDICYNKSSMNFLLSVYPIKNICYHIFESFSAKSHDTTIDFLLEEYPTIATAYSMNEFVDKFAQLKILSHNALDSLLSSFLIAHTKNCDSELLSEMSIICLIDRGMFVTIDSLINYRIISPEKYDCVNIIDSISNACDKYVKTERNPIENNNDMNIDHIQCKILFELMKLFSRNYTAYQWSSLINTSKSDSVIFRKFAKNIYPNNSSTELITQAFLKESLCDKNRK